MHIYIHIYIYIVYREGELVTEEGQRHRTRYIQANTACDPQPTAASTNSMSVCQSSPAIPLTADVTCVCLHHTHQGS